MYIKNLQDIHDWHNSVDRTVEEKIVWNSMHTQFDQKNTLKLTRQMKEDCGINCEDESERGCIEKMYNFGKSQIRKVTHVQREKSHVKILNLNSGHSKVPKKTNPK